MTVDRDLSAHQLSQTTADCETKAGAAVLAGSRTIALPKRVKDHRLLLGMDADPGVGDRNGEPAICGGVLGRRRYQGGRFPQFMREIDGKTNRPMLGELNRIVEQLRQNLLELVTIHSQLDWDLRCDLTVEFERFPRGSADKLMHDMGEPRMCIDRDRRHGDVARLDFRKI